MIHKVHICCPDGLYTICFIKVFRSLSESSNLEFDVAFSCNSSIFIQFTIYQSFAYVMMAVRYAIHCMPVRHMAGVCVLLSRAQRVNH